MTVESRSITEKSPILYSANDNPLVIKCTPQGFWKLLSYTLRVFFTPILTGGLSLESE